jgi:hypothetical protein
MLLRGQWEQGTDGFTRPLMHGFAQAADGSLVDVTFLVDTGADCTTFSPEIVRGLNLELQKTSDALGGLGGVVPMVRLRTRISFPREDGVLVGFNGFYAGVLSGEGLDVSVLGRDIINQFTLIADRPGDLVCLLGLAHTYVITMR